ncbi:unnamed protein product [Vitrella brassicaformis CCMP3155]|uniref:Uncharacterized protein n=1 Tax=Vitrella brassicaformis (strain CCMP3155) TaxID=1169540 RepID=A0A0G4EBG9_VITBC|nr:unnamed protein product [Vitrella brassicaformis CCMP3155]|eukprot:CEL92617.1 unnamed protein product [Vitrella brassicaformis CCMP3155]
MAKTRHKNMKKEGGRVMLDTTFQQLSRVQLQLEGNAGAKLGGNGYGRQYVDTAGRAIGNYAEATSGGQSTFSWLPQGSPLYVKLPADHLPDFNPSELIGDGFDGLPCVVRYYTFGHRECQRVLRAAKHMGSGRIEVRYGLSNPAVEGNVCSTLFVRVRGRDLLAFLRETYATVNGEGGGSGVVNVEIAKAHNWPVQSHRRWGQR